MPSTITLTTRSNASSVTCAEGLAAQAMVGTSSQPWASACSDKAGQADIDVAHGLEHVGALRHRRPAAAMHEVVIGRLRRCEGVGLVQEAANGDTGHQVCLSQYSARLTLDSSLRGAQATKQSSLACACAQSGLLREPGRHSGARDAIATACWMLRALAMTDLRARRQRHRPEIGEIPLPSGGGVKQRPGIGILADLSGLARPGPARRCGRAASPRHRRRFARRHADRG